MPSTRPMSVSYTHLTGPASQTLTSFGSNFLLQGPVSLPNISLSGGFAPDVTNAGPFTGSDNYELRDMVSVTKGKHSLFIGGELALAKTCLLYTSRCV